MRLFELDSLEKSNSYVLIDGIDDHSAQSISTILADVQAVVSKATSELIQHLHQLKHSEKYVATREANVFQVLTRILIVFPDMLTFWPENCNRK